jgi:hypothetical protein
MPRLLRNLRIHEVSSVTRGAGEGVKIKLRKADESAPARRKAIDLAFEALGDATVNKDGSVDFDAAIEATEVREALSGVMTELDEAVCALRNSFWSIMDDATLTDKRAAFLTSFEQFKEHLSGLAPEGMEKAIVAEAASRLKASADDGENDMTPEQLNAAVKKAVEDQLAATTAAFKKTADEQAAQIAKLGQELAFEKLSADHKAAMADMSDADKAKWLALSAEERDKKLKTKKSDNDQGDAELIRKVQESPLFKAQQVELDELKKRDAARTEAEEIRKAEDQAHELGLPRAHGAVMRKAFSGDAEAIKEHMRQLESLSRLAKAGDAFTTFAQQGDGGALPADSPIAKVNKRVGELQAAAEGTGKTITREQAIGKIAKTDAQLFAAYRAALIANPRAGMTTAH